jgi:hypothetical protein
LGATTLFQTGASGNDPRAQTTPANSKIPLADGTGVIDPNWLKRQGVVEAWVDPTGSNSNAGHQFSPFKTGAGAYTKLYGASGILLHLAKGTTWTDGTEPGGAWGNPLTAGQGCRLTITTQQKPGFWQVPANNPLFLLGQPTELPHFGDQLGASFLCGLQNHSDLGDGSGYRGDPAIWLDAGTGVLQLQNIFVSGTCPMRIGYDYARDKTFSYQQLNISQAVRSGASTVLTVTPWSYPIVSISRTSNVVTAVMGGPTDWFVPYEADVNVIVTITGSSDVNFPNGDYNVTAVPAANVIQFTSVGANASSGAIGNIISSGVGKDCRISLINTAASSEYPLCGMYRVTASTGGASPTVTIDDPWGGHAGRGDGTVNNLGHYLIEQRTFYAYGALNFRNISATTVAPPIFGFGGYGPGIDFGATTGFGVRIYDLCGAGQSGQEASAAFMNKDECALVLIDGIRDAGFVSGFGMNSSNGGWRVWIHDGQLQGGTFEHFLQDTGSGQADPTIEFLGKGIGASSFNCYDIGIADLAPPLQPAIRGCPGIILNISGTNMPGVAGVDPNGATVYDARGTEVFNQTVNWRSQRFQSERPLKTLYRGPGLAHTPVANAVSWDLSTWTLGVGVVMTGGQPDPNLLANAWKNTGASGTASKLGPSMTAGDIVCFGAWCKGAFGGNMSCGFTGGGAGIQAIGTYPITDMWEWIYGVAVADVNGQPQLSMTPQTNAQIAYPVLLPFPAANISLNDAWELVASMGNVNPAALAGELCGVDGQPLRARGRLMLRKGADIATANDVTFGFDGNSFKLTGATQVNRFATAGWQAGSQVRTTFASNPTVKNGIAGGGGFAGLALQGAADQVVAAGWIFTWEYDGTLWQEVARRTP